MHRSENGDRVTPPGEEEATGLDDTTTLNVVCLLFEFQLFMHKNTSKMCDFCFHIIIVNSVKYLTFIFCLFNSL